MLLTEIFVLGIVRPPKAIPNDDTKKVQPVKRIAKVDNDVKKKKPSVEGRIDTYA